jgi:hypothetical protein
MLGVQFRVQSVWFRLRRQIFTKIRSMRIVQAKPVRGFLSILIRN